MVIGAPPGAGVQPRAGYGQRAKRVHWGPAFWRTPLFAGAPWVAIGAEIGFVGLVLGFDLIVTSPLIRWIGPAAAGLAAVLFLAFGAHSILTLTGQPSGASKATARKSSFMIRPGSGTRCARQWSLWRRPTKKSRSCCASTRNCS